MANQNINIDDLLADPKFLDWVSRPDDDLDAYWNFWLKRNPNRFADLQQAKIFIQSFGFSISKTTPASTEKTWEKISEQIRTQERMQSKKVFFKQWAAIASGIVLFVMTLFWLSWDRNVYQVPYGGMEKIVLPDGSKVTLNANSQLRIGSDWKEEADREVLLEGEGFFEVNSKPIQGGTPFIVHTDKGDIKVLGTAFNVKNREGTFSVMLTEGKVELDLKKAFINNTTAIELLPGELADLNFKAKSIEKSNPTPGLYTAWIDGKLVCENTSIAELASLIEDQYGYQVIIEDPALLDRKLNGTLNNPSLADLIQPISLSFNIQVTPTNNKTIKISY